MLKRITKTTGLLLCAASVISFVPAKAADVQKIEAEEGTIYSASAKGKGIYLDGEINGKDESVYYISEDGKYNKLNGVEIGDTLKGILNNKYLEIDDGSDDYIYVDITDNYKIMDYDVRGDLEETEARLLKRNIKKDNDGRFDESSYDGTNKVEATNESDDKFLSAGTGLAIYKYMLKDSSLDGDKYSSIYADLQGNYVDADYNLGSIKVYTDTTTGSSVTLKNTEDTYKLEQSDKTYNLKAVLKEDKYITDISDSIYRFAKLTIYKKQKDQSDDEYTPVTASDGLKFGKNGIDVDGTMTVLHRFSKTAATDSIDGIKYSKDSDIYFIANKDGNEEYLLGKSGDAVKKLTKAASGGKCKIAGNEKGLCSIYLDTTNKKIYVEKIILKTKDQFKYIDIDDYVESDTDTASKIYTSGGAPWFINNGYIKTWDGDYGFKKVYKIDGGMNNLSISNKNNAIVWNEDKECYSIIHNVDDAATTTGTITAVTTGAAVTTSTAKVTAGWVLNQNNTWNYILEDGTKKTGWLNNCGVWYYLKADGVMATGWVQDGGSWYYCNALGAMLANTTADGYVLGANGAWIQ